MGHSHSSSHKRLRSISSAKNCGEFTEVVDLEFSDASTFSEPAINKALDNRLPRSNTSSNTFDQNRKSSRVVQEQRDDSMTIQYPKDLLLLEDHVKEIAQSIENMSPDEFFIYFPTLKDDLHNCWQKVYGIKDQNLETKLKKYKIIDSIRASLRKMNAKLQRRNFEQ